MAQTLRALVIEDNDDDCALLLRELRRSGYDPAYERVQTREEFRAALEGQEWDFVIADYSLPTFSAPDALCELQASGLDLPFVVVSGSIGEESAVTLMKAGAHDYLMKDHLIRLGAVIERELREAENRRERMRAEEQQRKLEAQLIQAQKLELLGRLAGGVAHDFNNVLQAVLGYASVIEADLPPTSSSLEDLGEIKNAVRRATQITRQLLAFGRRQILEIRTLDLNRVTSDFIKMLSRLIGEDVEIRTEFASGLGAVEADPTQIEQVLLNLAVNARDAMPGGGQLIIETANAVLDEEYARTHPEVRPGSYVLLSVSDTGAGMDKETQRRIFEPFFSTKDPGKGTGLGLATVYGIVKQHGGHICVYSELGRGTTFKIFLPQVEESARQATAPLAPARRSGGSETILVVEDDPVVRELVQRMLANSGYKTLVADSPGQAIHLAEQSGAIDLLLTDIVMPEMNGMQVYERISAIKPGIKVLFMSGYSANLVVQRHILTGNLPLLEKPFAEESLTRTIRETLDSEKTIS